MAAAGPTGFGGAPLVSLEFPATLQAVRGALVASVGELRRAGVPVGQRENLEIALAEVLNNIVEHACAGMPGASIAVQLHWDGAQVEVSVSDSGRPMPGRTVRPMRRLDPESLPEGGFGWNLILTLASDIAYVREKNRNQLWFAIKGEG